MALVASQVAPLSPHGARRLHRRHQAWQLELESAKALAEGAKTLLASAKQGAIASRETCAEAVSERLEALVYSVLERLEGNDEEDEQARQDLVLHLLSFDVPVKLVECLKAFDFELRKAVVRILSSLLKRTDKSQERCGTTADGPQVVAYVQHRPDLIKTLLNGCVEQEVFFNCALLLRSCTQSPELTQALFDAGAVPKFLDLALHQNFDISSEAFSSLRSLLLTQKDVAAKYVEVVSDLFFGLYHSLLLKDKDYVVQRQAVRLLGEMLLDANFRHVMTGYVQNDQFLQIHMNLLRNKSASIQLEAFHIFKLFVANPKRPQRVQQILSRNRDRLCSLLETLATKQKDDELFAADLQAILAMVGELQAR